MNTVDDAAHGSFLFTERQEAYRREMAEFADSFADGYHERARSTDFFWDIFRELAKRGVYAQPLEARLGGRGGTGVEAGIAMEEIGRADFNVGFTLFGALNATQILAHHGSDRVRDEWLVPLLAGDTAIGLALTEMAAGSDARGIETRAERSGADWVLTGRKATSGFAMVAGASVVFTRTGDGPADITAFLVPLDAPGVTTERIENYGFRPTGRGNIALDGVSIPDEYRIGGVGEGFGLVMHSFDFTRTLLGPLAIGAGQRALGYAIDYARTRETFGKPLLSRQGVTFPIAEHLAQFEAVRWLGYRALALRDAGLPHSKEAAMVKLLGTRAGVAAVHEAVVLMGHRGYSEELPLMQLQRDMIGLEIADGTAQIQKIIIAREALGRATTRRDA